MPTRSRFVKGRTIRKHMGGGGHIIGDIFCLQTDGPITGGRGWWNACKRKFTGTQLFFLLSLLPNVLY